MAAYDLNLLPSKAPAGPWTSPRRSTASAKVTVHFGDVASAAEDFVRGSDMLLGCVAWVKSPRLVAALAERPVALVVNKEFGLRVEGHHEREPLTLLTGGVPAKHLVAPAKRTGTLDTVRCAGWTAKGKFGAFMHHKFLVRLSSTGRPLMVWTGSFNFTAGAERNIENGMVIDDPKLAAAYLAEFSRVWALSEPLNFATGAPKPGDQRGAPVKPPRKKTARTRATAKKARRPRSSSKRTRA
ncbi:MAG TPA: phospholipase D-like domain-containing protein [Protaetiibacter sp.]|nr:phospholipase D-like domain-containing protein [Protaetiibacter sp.]